MNVIETKNAPGAIGPYSQGYAFGDLVITSGQIPVDPATGTTPKVSPPRRSRAAERGRHLGAAGSGFDKVVKTTCFLADMGDFAAFNEVYARYFTSSPPAAAWPCGSPGACSARSKPSR
ncbi:MAG: Rid family hydrolase [Dysosmobacter welbionis]